MDGTEAKVTGKVLSWIDMKDFYVNQLVTIEIYDCMILPEPTFIKFIKNLISK